MIRLFALLCSVLLAWPLQAQEEMPELKVGDQSPEWKLMREDSSMLTIADVDADYILLLFWHYKCSHCQKALTKIDDFLAKTKPTGFKIVSIYPFASDTDDFWRYVKNPENLLTDPVFIHSVDYKAQTRRAFSQHGAPPLLILLDKQGKVLATQIKANKLDELWKTLQGK